METPQPLDYAHPRPRRPRQYRAIWLVLWLPLVTIILLATLTFTSNSRPRTIANRVRSASNLRQIGQAILLYSNDNNGQYPDCLQRLLFTEDITSAVFVASTGDDTPATGPTTRAIADQVVTGGHLSYIYVGRGMNNTAINSDTVVAYEPPSLNANQGGNVLFGDGHVEFLTHAQMLPMLARLAAGESPVRVPLPP